MCRLSLILNLDTSKFINAVVIIDIYMHIMVHYTLPAPNIAVSM